MIYNQSSKLIKYFPDFYKSQVPPWFEHGISCLLDRRFNQLSHGTSGQRAVLLVIIMSHSYTFFSFYDCFPRLVQTMRYHVTECMIQCTLYNSISQRGQYLWSISIYSLIIMKQCKGNAKMFCPALASDKVKSARYRIVFQLIMQLCFNQFASSSFSLKIVTYPLVLLY